MTPLINRLIERGYLRDIRLIDAFSHVQRMEFLPDRVQDQSDADIALPIGYGQTNSQPSTVALMLGLLDLKEGYNILDVGSGSGYTSALLAEAVGVNGHVTALEIIPDLCEIGKTNAEKYGLFSSGRVEFRCVDAHEGCSDNAPYDRILVSATVDEIPKNLVHQLKEKGKMVIPVHNDVWFVEKISEKELKKEEFPGFSFVPFITRTKL